MRTPGANRVGDWTWEALLGGKVVETGGKRESGLRVVALVKPCSSMARHSAAGVTWPPVPQKLGPAPGSRLLLAS